MVELITTALTTVLTWVGTVLTSVVSDTGQLHALAPLFVIGIAISVVMLGVKIFRSFTWGA